MAAASEAAESSSAVSGGITPLHEDSSDSDGDLEPAKSFHRRISTNRNIKTTKCIKEGYMLKQRNFQRWQKRYFKLKGQSLYYAKDTKSVIYDEIELVKLSVAECSTKNVNHSFQVITPFRNLVLAADSRREMEEWIHAVKSAANRDYYESRSDTREMLSGLHNWYACSHARPTYCNICMEALSGVTSHGLSCEVCKFKAHKRCAVRAPNNCKWTTLAAVGKDNIIEEEDGSLSMPHQWLQGNLPVSAKCAVCEKTCGSVLRLQDWRCLWCRAMVHTACREQFSKRCPLGLCRISILPPTHINSLDSDGYWEATKPSGTSPLLVFLNTKSGDNQGVKFLRRFKQLLNPAQVFDLINGGPSLGLKLFQKFESFRILVCGGDGSVAWVLSEIDKLDLHNQCQCGILPLGTGNDLARVLGWGSAFDDDTLLSAVIERLEHAQIKMLDRWGIMVYEGTMPPPRRPSQLPLHIASYEHSVAAHLSKILHSDDHGTVISSAKVLCETVKELLSKVGENEEGEMKEKCAVLNQKLDALMCSLDIEAKASPPTNNEDQTTSQGGGDAGGEVLTSMQNIDVEVSEDADMKRREEDVQKLREVLINSQVISLPVIVATAERFEDKSKNTCAEAPVIEIDDDFDAKINEPFESENENESFAAPGGLDLPSLNSSRKHSAVEKDLLEISEKEQLSEQSSSPDDDEINDFERNDVDKVKSSATTKVEIHVPSNVSSKLSSEQYLTVPTLLSETTDSIARPALQFPSLTSEQRPSRLQATTLPVPAHMTQSELRPPVKATATTSKFTLAPPRSTAWACERPPQEVTLPDYPVMVSVAPLTPVAEAPLDSKVKVDGPSDRPQRPMNKRIFLPREQLVCRANSLKKAIRQIIEHTERAVDEQNGLTAQHAAQRDTQLTSQCDFNIPVVTTDMFFTPDEETSDVALRSPSAPASPRLMDSLAVPSFFSSSDGEASGSSTPYSFSRRTSGFSTKSGASSRRASGVSTTSMSSYEDRSPSPTRRYNEPKSPRSMSRAISRMSTTFLGGSPLIGAHSQSASPQEKSPARESSREPAREFPLLGAGMLPMMSGGLGSGVAGSLAGGSFISKVLLANADALCAAASPLVEDEIDIDDFTEKCVMNNYFGIGLDAKISLDFHIKREEHPEKCRNRKKNIMWYGLLGGKEIVSRTFRNLDQRVLLECDGQRIHLPSLQGIVVLNIPSYMGGANFWGGAKEKKHFKEISFDDRILEVVAVFGSVQLGLSKFYSGLQHHRIAQCRSVKITILGNEPVPVQVDGEAWSQAPGFIRIVHKNRARMLTRDKVFEEALKTWTERQRLEKTHNPRQHSLTDVEIHLLKSFIDATQQLIHCVRMAALVNNGVNVELSHLAKQASEFLERLYPDGRLMEPAVRTQVSDLVSSVRSLHNHTRAHLQDRSNHLRLTDDVMSQLNTALTNMDKEMKTVYSIGGLPHFQKIQEEDNIHKVRKEKSRFRLVSRLMRGRRKEGDGRPNAPSVNTISQWTTSDVSQWLDSLGLVEYKDMFASHDIQGRELLTLGKSDIKELGVTKMGHIKRLEHGIRDIIHKLESGNSG